MQAGFDIYMLCGVWGIVMMVIFIMAIRLSYKIEARSEGLRNTSGIPRKAMMFHTITNISVARDAETQGMRRRMNRLLLVNLAGFILLWVFLRVVQQPG